MRRTEKMINLYHEINTLNEAPICITGTLMLKLRGIKVGRKPKDLDLLISDDAGNIKVPQRAIEVPNSTASDGSGVKYKIDGILVDIMSSSEEQQFVRGFLLAPIEDLIKAKERYAKQDNPNAKKHAKDLRKIRRQIK